MGPGRRLALASLLALTLGIPSSAPRAAASDDGLSIEHAAVSCVLADHYPQMRARVEPAERAARARLFFRASGTEPWFFVDMDPGDEKGAYEGTLPKPKPTTPGIDYYIQAISDEFADTRTGEYAAKVVAPGGCKQGEIEAPSVSSAKVSVGGGPDKRQLPAGFSAAGIVRQDLKPATPAHRPTTKRTTKRPGQGS